LTDRFNIERLWRLPDSTWCYREPEDSSAVIDHPPRDDNGYVTFGCFNNFAKVTDPVLAAWAKLLDMVPSSRLMLKIKGIDSVAYRAEVENRLLAHGIPVERLILVDQQKERPFALYNRIDIALDPFPYNGCTTSFETLWMGVPFVTLAGQSGVSRVGVSILANAGLSELAAESVDDYVNRAALIALDASRLKALRSGLRERIRQGPLMDARRWTACLEQAYREMWQRWCKS
jgi:predicted O-linked N-acetylglucosamine transferase (SPINDLY family)